MWPACVVAFVDVGQGDCTFVLDRRKHAAGMIDCPNSGYNRAEAKLSQWSVESLDAFLISHWDEDHWSALPRILSDLQPRIVAYNIASIQVLRQRAQTQNDLTRAGAALRSLKRGAERGDFARTPLVEGTSLTLGDADLQCLAPNFDEASDAVGGSATDKNLGSAVIRLSYQGCALVVGGDAPRRVWRRLCAEYPALRAHVLRSPHHGSMSVEEPKRLEAFREVYEWLSPLEVIHSVGRSGENYGHPNEEGIEAAGGLGIRVLCTGVTDKCCADLPDGHVSCAGDVEIQIDEQGSWVRAPAESEHALQVDRWGASAMCRKWGGGPPSGEDSGTPLA